MECFRCALCALCAIALIGCSKKSNFTTTTTTTTATATATDRNVCELIRVDAACKVLCARHHGAEFDSGSCNQSNGHLNCSCGWFIVDNSSDKDVERSFDFLTQVTAPAWWFMPMAGRVYVPLPEKSLRSVQASCPVSVPEGRLGQRLLVATLAELGLEEQPFQAASTMNLDLKLSFSAIRNEGSATEAQTSKWLEQARDEHASVAAFAMLQLDLMAHGAPVELLSRVLDASHEELLHVAACEALAGSRRENLALPEHEVRTLLHQNWPQLLQRSLHEGALPEGAAALRLWQEAHQELSKGRHARAQLLWAMGHDEARHAELAHDIATWAAAAHGATMPVLHIGKGNIWAEGGSLDV